MICLFLSNVCIYHCHHNGVLHLSCGVESSGKHFGGENIAQAFVFIFSIFVLILHTKAI